MPPVQLEPVDLSRKTDTDTSVSLKSENTIIDKKSRDDIDMIISTYSSVKNVAKSDKHQ